MTDGSVADGPGNRRGRATRSRILAIAEERFAAAGIDLTLDEVARAAGTTRMTVHRHTGGREALITHLVLRASTSLADEVRDLLEGEGPFGDRLGASLVAIVERIRAAPHLVGLFTPADPLGAWPALDPDERLLGAVQGFFRPYLQAAADEGLLRADPMPTIDWLLRQVLVFLMVPDAAPTRADVADQVATFVLPAVLQRSEAATR